MMLFFGTWELLISAWPTGHWSNPPKNCCFFLKQNVRKPIRHRHLWNSDILVAWQNPMYILQYMAFPIEKKNSHTKKNWHLLNHQLEGAGSLFLVWLPQFHPRPVRNGGFVSCLWLPAKRFYQGKDLFFGRDDSNHFWFKHSPEN